MLIILFAVDIAKKIGIIPLCASRREIYISGAAIFGAATPPGAARSWLLYPTQIKCKILKGTYILQASRATFNQYSVNPTCKLCCRDPETRQHYVGGCAFFEAERSVYIEKLSTSPILSDDHISQLRNPELLTQLTLDVSRCIENFDSEELGSFELYTREYLHRLHVKRVVALRKLQ